jgi:alpha-tubulin suppressor-like RCC1 family protein
MVSKWSFLFFITAVFASCTPQNELYNMPVPATLEYGQLNTVSKEDNWNATHSMEFGRRATGSTSKNTVHVKNTGNLPATITKVWVEADHPEFFKVASQCSVIARSEACRINLSYAPDTVGDTPATLHMNYNDGSGTVKDITLPIKAVATNLAFLKFEREKIDIKSNTVGYTLSSYFKVKYNGSTLVNNGFKIEPAKGVSISDPLNTAFKIERATTTCGDVIQSDCMIKVDFSPLEIGLASSSFDLSYFNGAEVLKLTAEASGTGLEATVVAELKASDLDFGNVVSNSPAPKGMSLPINFTGSIPAENIVLYSPVNNVFSISSDKSKTTCGTRIDGSCALFIDFAPMSNAAQTGSITLEYTSNGQVRPPLNISLSGQGVDPALIISNVETLALGEVPAYKKLSKQFILTNSGGVPITQLSALTLSDTLNFSASFEAKCASLAPQATCLLTVNFLSKTAANASTNLNFSYFDGKEIQKINLNATATNTSPLALEGSRTIDFGNVMIGKPILPLALNTNISIFGLETLTNDTQFVINPAALKSPFAFNATTCRPPFDPKKSNSCMFGLAVTSNVGFPADLAVTQDFTMSYKGDDKSVGVLSFKAQMTPRIAPVIELGAVSSFKTISVNDATYVNIPLKNKSPYFATAFKSVVIEDSTNFEVSSNSCSGGLVAGASCNIIVKFNPKNSGLSEGVLKYTYHDQIKDVVIAVNLSARASSDVTLLASESALDFGPVYVGDVIPAKIVHLKYFGDTEWTQNIKVAAPFKVTALNCGAIEDCQLKVEYAPTSAGNHNEEAQISYSPSLSEVGIQLNLKGSASTRAPVFSVTPASLPKTLVGNQSTHVVTIKNSGNTNAVGITLSDLQGILTYAKDGAPGSAGNCKVGQNLNVGESCIVKVVFNPVKVGKSEINFNIGYISGNTKSSVDSKISVTGTQVIKVFAGGFQTCIINEVGAVVCWGRNTSGQLGLGSKNSVLLRPSDIPVIKFDADIVVKSLAVGDSHTCAIVSSASVSNKVICWGSNESGRLGIGEPAILNILQPSKPLKFVELGLDENVAEEEVSQISAGFEHTCALTISGKVKCWGGNTSGQLGYDNKVSVGLTKSSLTSLKPVLLTRKAVSISAGAGHTCAVLDNGSSKCWGDNFYGQLGAGSVLEKIGVIPGQMQSLYEINLGSSFSLKELIASNGAFTCALSVSGDVKCFGKAVSDETSVRPFYGVLGNCYARVAQNSVALPCSKNTTLRLSTSLGYMPSDMGENLSKINMSNVNSLALGSNFSCALNTDSQVKCWGANEQGQLGLGGITNVGETPSEMLGLKVALDNVAQIAAGYEHACAVLKDNTLKCWGSNFQNATALTTLGVATSRTVVPANLPVVYDGR